jgi:CBS domain-containing membrane protein
MSRRNFDDLTVGDVMTTEVVTVNRNDKLATANDVMNLGRIRHMPVLDDDGRLEGIVSQRDLFHNLLLRAMGYGSISMDKVRGQYAVKEAMSEPVMTTTAGTPLREAAQTMLQAKVGCLVVVDDAGKVTGILTEADFVALAAEE